MIRFAKETDIDKIMAFINAYWREGHILGNNSEFFRYEHILDKEVTYVISTSNNDDNIDAILGYIPYGRQQRDAMTVMWKANHTSNPTLGIDLLLYLKENADVRILASPGINKKTGVIYKYLGFSCGQMIQWYRLGNKKEYKIAKVNNNSIPKAVGSQLPYKKYDVWEELIADFNFDTYYKSNPKPLKEAWYIKKRYFCHPIYKYDIYGLLDESGETSTICVIRKVNINDSCMLRFVDCIGSYSQILNATDMIDHVMDIYGAECIDCYEVGLPDEYFYKSGWTKTLETSNIIPNYFAPFTQENIDINYFTSDPEIVLFKGDGDQDRPN